MVEFNSNCLHGFSLFYDEYSYLYLLLLCLFHIYYNSLTQYYLCFNLLFIFTFICGNLQEKLNLHKFMFHFYNLNSW